ncbi:MAG: 4'-phosphopantetheinyl transferase superfamily protein [Eubacterium sp.]|nr:4'-phosphopantetheinyl transferase superfamily protein [Eubacterium sp.]MDD7209618.1 4'-phosphopantetheinyl transferase superfamily protein [Lachnospiraceae bacterium]MDY5497985.1 4'-phosphopantetheinyl transferase superfamily protein [Anaerobutyricum sp.]
MRGYLLEITDFPDPADFEQWKKYLPVERWDRTLRPVKKEDRIVEMAAWLLLAFALKREGIRNIPGNYSYGPHGKPEREEICFNIAHSGSVIFCVISEKEVGCDIEKIRPVNRKIANRFFSERETEALESCAGREKEELFTRLWMMRESYAKKTGEGLSLLLDHISIMPERMEIIRDGKPMTEQFRKDIFGEYEIAVCADHFTEEKMPLTVVSWEEIREDFFLL